MNSGFKVLKVQAVDLRAHVWISGSPVDDPGVRTWIYRWHDPVVTAGICWQGVVILRQTFAHHPSGSAVAGAELRFVRPRCYAGACFGFCTQSRKR